MSRAPLPVPAAAPNLSSNPETARKNRELAARGEKLEASNKDHASIISILAEEIDALRQLPEPKRRPIGFTANLDE